MLDRIERYFTVAPRADALVQMVSVGALDVPVGPPEWPYPARPRPGREGEVAVADVRAAVDLQERSGLPASLEWLGDRCRGLAGGGPEAGLPGGGPARPGGAGPAGGPPPPGGGPFLVGAPHPRPRVDPRRPPPA